MRNTAAASGPACGMSFERIISFSMRFVMKSGWCPLSVPGMAFLGEVRCPDRPYGWTGRLTFPLFYATYSCRMAMGRSEEDLLPTVPFS